MRGGEYWEEQKAHKIVSICRKKCKKIKTESDFLGRCFLGGDLLRNYDNDEKNI